MHNFQPLQEAKNLNEIMRQDLKKLKVEFKQQLCPQYEMMKAKKKTLYEAIAWYSVEKNNPQKEISQLKIEVISLEEKNTILEDEKNKLRTEYEERLQNAQQNAQDNNKIRDCLTTNMVRLENELKAKNNGVEAIKQLLEIQTKLIQSQTSLQLVSKERKNLSANWPK